MSTECPNCGYSYSWDNKKKTCSSCKYTDRVKTKKKTGIPKLAVEAGSGGKLIPRPPSITIKMMQEAKDLEEKGMKPEAIAAHMDKSVGWVKSSLLIVKNLPEKVHNAIEQHRFSRIVALQLLLCPPDKLDAVIDGAIKLSETEGKLD